MIYPPPPPAKFRMSRALPISLATIASAVLFAALFARSDSAAVHAQQGGAPMPTPTPEQEIEFRIQQVPPREGKINPPKHDGMDYQLNEIVRQSETEQLSVPARRMRRSPERSVAVTFYIEEAHVRDVWEFLQANGAPALEPASDEDFIEAEVPVSLLVRASEQPGVIAVKSIVPPQPAQESAAESGLGKGAAAHGAVEWQRAGYRGQGVKSHNRLGIQTIQRTPGRGSGILCAGQVLQKRSIYDWSV